MQVRQRGDPMTRAFSARTTRRQFLRTGNKGEVQRPPWTDEERVKESCTSCGACISACPEAILIAGPAKTPIVDFSLGACSFCQNCVSACDENVFSDTSEPPWNLKAGIKNNCMLSNGISCQICADSCLEEALKFDLSHFPSGKMNIETEACTGCGACLSVCPINAIQIEPEIKGPEHV